MALQRFEYCIALKRFEYYILLNKGKLLLLGLELNHGGHFSLTWLASITIFQNMDWSNGQCALLGSVDSLIFSKFSPIINWVLGLVWQDSSTLIYQLGFQVVPAGLQFLDVSIGFGIAGGGLIIFKFLIH